jgi:hypothetical protein
MDTSLVRNQGARASIRNASEVNERHAAHAKRSERGGSLPQRRQQKRELASRQRRSRRRGRPPPRPSPSTEHGCLLPLDCANGGGRRPMILLCEKRLTNRALFLSVDNQEGRTTARSRDGLGTVARGGGGLVLFPLSRNRSVRRKERSDPRRHEVLSVSSPGSRFPRLPPK